MTIQFQLDMEDLLAFQSDVIKHSHTHQVKKSYYRWISTIVLFLLVLLLVETTPATVVGIFILTIIYYFSFPFLYQKLSMLLYKNQLKKKDFSHLFEPCEMTLSDTGIERKLNEKTSHFTWDQFQNKREDTNHYFLYVSDLEALIIPKHLLHLKDEERVDLQKLFERYIPQR